MPTTTGMKGGGYYDAHSKEQRAALDEFLPWMEEAITNVPMPAEPQIPFGMLDIGSSEGGNAIYALNRLIRTLRGVADLPIWVFFDDLPTNDFNHLFSNLFPGRSAALVGDNIFPCVIGASAFSQIVPSRTVHVVTTFNAIGFLETRPDTELPRYILPMGPGPLAPRQGVSVTERERVPFARQAAKDLLAFYTARSQEIVSGGKLLVQVFGRDQRVSTSYGIYDVLSDAVLDLVEEGILRRELYEKLIFPIYFRTIEELLAPIHTDATLSRVFRVEKAESHDVPVPFNEALAATGDVKEWANRYTGFLRAFTETITAAVLPDDLPGSDSLDEIYRRVEQRLIADPARYEFHYISVAALLTRV